jgi:hypothetical protein
MTLNSAIYKCIKSKKSVFGVKIKDPHVASRAIVAAFFSNLNKNEVSAYVKTTHSITVEETLWDITGEGNTPEEMQLIGKFNFSTNNFELPSKWVRDGSKFLGKGPMDIKEALVTYSNLCQDCSNLAGMFDLGGLTWSETLEKAIDDKVICSTECDMCELWITQVIQKYIIDPCSVGKYIEGMYRNGRRLFVNVLPAPFSCFNVSTESEYLEYVESKLSEYTSRVFRKSCHYDCCVNEDSFRKKIFDIGIKSVETNESMKIKHSDFTKMWPYYRKGPYMFTVTDSNTGISTFQGSPPINDVSIVKVNGNNIDKDDLGLKTVIPQERKLEGLAEELSVLGHTDLSDIMLSYTGSNTIIKKIDETIKSLKEYKEIVPSIEKDQEKTIDRIRFYLDEVMEMIHKSIKSSEIIHM